MIQPTPRAIWTLGAGLPVAALPALLGQELWLTWMVFLGVFLVLLGVDLLLARRPGDLRSELTAADVLHVGAPAEIGIALSFPAGRPFLLELTLDADDELELATPWKGWLVGGDATVRVAATARRRGTYALHRLWLRWHGPLGLVRRTTRRPLDVEVRVVPDVRPVHQTAIRFLDTRQLLAGTKSERYLGDGSEFQALREYLPGHDHRAIDWKASARHTRLLAREFRAERNHQVILAFDTGHLMREPLGGAPKLDRAITSGLLLAYVGLRTGDRVGLFAFDEEVRHYSQPRAGVAALSHLQRAAAGLEYSTAETNFTLGLTDLSTRLPRRSLVILFTDFVDTVTAELMVENLGRMAGRHVVVFVTFDDLFSSEVANRMPRDTLDVHRAVVAHDLLLDREKVLRRLKRLGVHCLQTRPERLSSELIGSYLRIVRKELV